MTTLTEAGREYWRDVLLAGGFTAVPRWTLDPALGVAECEVPIPNDVVATLVRLADEVGVPLHSILLTAHAKVLAALSGDREVSMGYVPVMGGRPLPCRLTIESGTWRVLLAAVRRSESELLTYKNFPLDELAGELGLTEPPFEIVFDPAGRCADLIVGDTVIGVGVSHDDDQLRLRLRYRTDVLNADCVARIAGYHLAALTLLGSETDTEHDVRSLLSAEELRLQLDGLAGPRRELPDQRCHELFEQRVRAHPDTVAAVHGDRRWTYRELNARANRLGRALLACGLRREDVVAVVTARNLDWMAAALAVFKAGGAYLPIEPNFPADRIAATLSRAGCRLVLTERGSIGTLDQAIGSLPGIQILHIDEVFGEDHADGDLDVDVSPDQLAYIYFTSGSTGEPKGAMCEHAGMLNHLYAKIDDLGIGEGQVVAQTAPQCFDISLWQLVSALMVGGRTLIVEQEVILDVARFIDKVIDARVNVLQVVPSYLEAVISYLEQYPVSLPDLRCVSVTGEAIKKELTQRWFAAEPDIKLINAYGLTETSDDTNHEVMDRAPARERVPLGRAINNVRVYVVDEHLSPVPLGAPGEIAFSGICVGRGYINDPERTRAAFMADPYRVGERLYRSGDHGRWLPEGKLEFLGRRDTQVKIRGFRIEIGEIENTLLRAPGVRDGAVVVAERHGGKRLVAFYSGEPQQTDVLRAGLSASLPEYMVPSALYWRESLPLTPNSKIDKTALTALVAELDSTATADQRYHEPRTGTERRVAAAWAKVLGIPENLIGRQDQFFARGGTSLSAVKLVIALDRAVSLKDVTRYPGLADLAALLDGRLHGQSGLLQPLSEPDSVCRGTLVCFPHAGGNALNFQPMARVLRVAGLSVYGVELPGHDLAAELEPLAPMTQVIDRVVAEIIHIGVTEVLLWGQSSGAAFALEAARKMQDHGVRVKHVFIGSQLLGDIAERRAGIAALTGQSDTQIAAQLSTDFGYADLGALDERSAEQIGGAYRHDLVSAHRYFADALDTPPVPKLSATITVVVAADDPVATAFPHRYSDWQLFAEQVDLHLVSDGGHYFPHTRPAAAARTVLCATPPERKQKGKKE